MAIIHDLRIEESTQTRNSYDDDYVSTYESNRSNTPGGSISLNTYIILSTLLFCMANFIILVFLLILGRVDLTQIFLNTASILGIINITSLFLGAVCMTVYLYIVISIEAHKQHTH
jgi:hypothetical protein